MFRHTKLTFCSTVKVADLCKMLFGQNKCLAVLEKATTNPHIHIQGLTDMSESYYNEKFRLATQEHWMRHNGEKHNPVKHSKKDINEKGFQYMCKEGPPAVLFQQGFLPGEIEELHKLSDQHVDQLKHGLKRKLHEVDITDMSPEQVHTEYRVQGIDYYLHEDKMPPPNFQKHILWAMATKTPSSPRRKRYVAERI